MSWEADVSWASLRAFIETDVATGGPDPHMTVIAEAGRLSDVPWWPAVAFVAGPYTVAGSTAIAANCGRMTEAEIEEWLRENWKGIPIRGERRCVKSPKKMAASLASTRAWAWDTFDCYMHGLEPPSDYEALWAGVQQHCKYMGRYGAMKLLETWWRGGLITKGQPDIRPDGAKYPRRMLAALWLAPTLRVAPKEGGSGNTRAALDCVNYWASEAKDRVGYDLTWCSFETLLCNYRQALQKGKYPGGSHDRELQHWLVASEHFGAERMLEWLPFYEIRRRCFPVECLGEIGGWTETRKELEMPWRERYEAANVG